MAPSEEDEPLYAGEDMVLKIRVFKLLAIATPLPLEDCVLPEDELAGIDDVVRITALFVGIELE